MECVGKMSTQQQRGTTRALGRAESNHRSVALSSIRLPEPRRCLAATKEVTHLDRSQWLRSALGHRSLDHHPLIVLTERLPVSLHRDPFNHKTKSRLPPEVTT